jgi:hypothetical protein
MPDAYIHDPRMDGAEHRFSLRTHVQEDGHKQKRMAQQSLNNG